MLAGFSYVLLLTTGVIAAVLMVWRGLRHPIDWDRHHDWLKSRPWTWREALVAIGAVGSMILLANGLALLLHKPSETTMVVIQSIFLDATGVLLIALIAHMRSWSWADAFGMTRWRWDWLRAGVLFYLVLLPFLLFVSLIYQGILFSKGYPTDLQDIALLLSADNPIWLRLYLGFLAVFLAPLFEECLFRGILLPLLVRNTGLGTGIFITSLAFSAIHLHLPSLIPLMVVAAALSLAYLYTRCLWVPIVMHALFNGINLILLTVIRN